MIQFPLISEYEVAIKKSGSAVLNLPDSFEFIPNRTVPIKFFNFGSGAFAGIFKVRNTSTNKVYALRCFLNGGNPEDIDRTITISEFLQTLSESWVCKSTVYQHGIAVKGDLFPVILMEWTTGKKINDYVSSIIADNNKIAQLQEKIVQLSKSLESNGIAHGDIQSGNLLVEEANNHIILKLVDYDPMYIPALSGKMATETGHSSFQHPKRTKTHFNEKIDRFSFWLLLTALEAVKFDKTLWNKDLRGGFNDEDNFLFKVKDLLNPQTSPLVNRLRSLNQKSVNYYLDKLFSGSLSPDRDPLKLFQAAQILDKVGQNVAPDKSTPVIPITKLQEGSSETYLIESVPTGAQVFLMNGYTKTLIGATPLKLPVRDFTSKQVIVVSENEEKAFYLNNAERNFKIDFSVNRTRPKEYGVYLNGQMQYLTLSQFIYEVKSGTNFDKVYVGGKETPVQDIAELRLAIIQNRPKVVTSAPISHPKAPILVTQNTSDNTPLFVLLGFLVIGVIIWLAVANSNQRYETVETASETDSAAFAYSDSAAVMTDYNTAVIDSAEQFTVDAARDAAAATTAAGAQTAKDAAQGAADAARGAADAAREVERKNIITRNRGAADAAKGAADAAKNARNDVKEATREDQYNNSDAASAAARAAKEAARGY